MQDEPSLLSAASAINSLIAHEIASGTDAKRIVLGGFSQGGMLSLFTGITTEKSLGGVICLSGRLPLVTRVQEVRSSF